MPCSFLAAQFRGTPETKKMIYLMSDWLVKQLLMFDMVLYGAIVRDTMAEMNIHDFVDDGGIIECTGPFSIKPYLERLLHDVIVESTIVHDDLTSCNTEYTFDHIDRHVKVDIQYYKCVQKDEPRSIDVNCLCLSRIGLFLTRPVSFQPSIFQNHPCPLLAILEQCRKKEFRVVGGFARFERVKGMVRQGWTLKNGAVHRCDEPPTDDCCCICKNRFHNVSTALPCVETRCGHVYHTSCWRKYLKSRDNSGNVSCPLCRHEMQPWEAVV